MRIQKITPDFLEVGDIISCNTGASPPADGTIMVDQQTVFTFDESMLTGESMPVVKRAGDQVFLGSINRGQSVHIKVDKIGVSYHKLDNIVKVVREGSTRRAPIERVADVITGYFVPAPTALLVCSGLAASGKSQIAMGCHIDTHRDHSGHRRHSNVAMASMNVYFGNLARGGGEAFPEMEHVDVIAFDKTGTLTMGEEPRVSDCEFTTDTCWEKEALLRIAAELESATSHPLAIAIRHYCASNGAVEQAGSSFVETAGLGIEAKFALCTGIIGSQAFMEQHGVVIHESTLRRMQIWKSEAKSIVFLAVSDGSDSGHFRVLAAVFAVTDPIRSEAPSVISWLTKQVARMVGIPASNVIAGVLPHEKVTYFNVFCKNSSAYKVFLYGEKIQMLQADGPKRPTRV
ncbi:E1-E2 ATPase-domain-containing protein [Mycena leptocephala]|nr:E1-E2 ATPase-domain-containing protein [Mycena leptocephala]